MADLVIKISGDVKDYKEALKMAEEETSSLNDSLQTATAVSAIAFAALTAEVFFSVRALNVEAKALDEVTQALQNQGIYSDALAKSYRDVAEEIEKKTGVDADAISSGQAVAQGLIGQTEISQDLTKAVVDLAAAQKIDLASAFTVVAKGINGNVAGLQKMGLSIDEGLSKQERLAAITETLGQKFGGSAEKIAHSAGSVDLFNAAIGNAQKEIGRRFQPVFDSALATLTKFVTYFNEHKAVADFTVAVIAAGIAVSSIGLVVGTAGLLFLKFKAALLAAQIATGAMTIATRALVGATGIGLLVIILTELYLNWSTVWPRMQAIYQGFAENILKIAGGLGKIIYAVLVPSLDSINQIKEGGKQIGEALKAGYETATKDIKPPTVKPGVQDDGKAKAAAIVAAKEADLEARKRETKQASLELSKLQEEKASLELIELKKNEVELLKQIEDDKNKNIRGSLERRLQEVRDREEEEAAFSKERRKVLNDDLLAENEAFQQLNADQKKDFLDRNQQQIEQGLLTSLTVRQEAVKQELETQKKANNTFLLEQMKFGTAYATINKLMHSAVYQGTKQAFGELAQLQESSNSTLKSIGKVAAIANIVIRTAESAMAIYAGFSTIPIVGPVLGVAGAAAAVAFGAEQVSKVRGAAKGGLAQGGIKGKDSIPFMLQDQELVAPSKNFDEVIGSVRAGREAKKMKEDQSANNAASEAMVAALGEISSKLDNRQAPSVTVQGDFFGEQSFVDKFVEKISDSLEFRNTKIFGVNT